MRHGPRSREVLLVGLSVLVVLSGCGGSSPIRGQTVTVTDGIDRDCDGYYQSLQLQTDVMIGRESAASSDASVVLSYRTDNDGFTTIRTFEDLSGWTFQRNITVSGSDLGDGRTLAEFRAVGKRSTILGTETVNVGTSEPVKVEPPGDDKSMLKPSYTQEPPKPNRSEPLTLTAKKGSTECAIDLYEWDIDDDGSFERTGQTVTLEYTMDGRHDVTLKMTDAGGTTERVTGEVLVFYDPDGDGITSAREERQGTDPHNWDSDGDLFSDRIDPNPTTFIVPTGLIHVLLTVVTYFLTFRYRDELARLLEIVH